MKRLVLAAACAGMAQPLFAGTSQAPQLDVAVISQGANAASIQQWIVPAVFVGMLLLVISTPASHH